MAGEDELYLTVASEVPYVQYVAAAYKIVKEIYEFGKESDEQRAIRELQNRVAALEDFVRQLDDRLSALEVRVAQVENRARLRSIREHQLALSGLARDLNSHPEDAGDIAAKAFDRLVAMIEDDDLWLWSDIVEKPEGGAPTWRPAGSQFKGLPLPAFAVGIMVWALAVQHHLSIGGPAGSHSANADRLLAAVTTRPQWVVHTMAPQSIVERFRTAIRVEIWPVTKYVNPAGYCVFGLVGVNDIDRSRSNLRDVDIYYGPSPNALCTVNPNIAEGDEAILEDDFPAIQILTALEEVVSRIRYRGSLADPWIGQFPNWTAHRLTMFGVEQSGQLRRFQLDTTTALIESPTVTPIGGVVGTGWGSFAELHATRASVVYAVSGDGAIDWYREDDVARGPNGWAGPNRVHAPRGLWALGESYETVNAGNGSLYQIRQHADGFRFRRSLELMSHAGIADGSGVFGDSSLVAAEWPSYAQVFGGDGGVIYGIDAAGDLFWHRHSTFPVPSTQLEGPVKIGNGWTMFVRVFSLGAGFLCGVRPNGEMLLYHFVQWRWGPGNAAPVWHGPVKVPGTQWRAFRFLFPSVGDAPVIVP